MKHSLLFSALLALGSLALTSRVHARTAQKPDLELPQASPAATLKQRIGVTDVEIEYSRPSAKGRKIFGSLVPLDEVWRTGANSATKITFSGDVKIEGTPVPAGTYALFTIPGTAQWTFILNKVPGQWGAYAYDEKNDQLRVKVKPVALQDAVETLTFDIGDLRTDSARFSIAWEKTRASVQIATDIVAALVPKIQAAMAAEGKKPYLSAAMFYYENNLDLKQALAWIEEAVKESPDAPWVMYRKGLILAKTGDKAGALAAANKSAELAAKAGGSVGVEYKRLSEALIASLK